jgi:Polysaccharide lyase
MARGMRQGTRARRGRAVAILGVSMLTIAALATAPDRPAHAKGSEAHLSKRSCKLSRPGSSIGMRLRGCRTVFTDTASDPNPLPKWGEAECADASRVQQLTKGGDPSPKANGSRQRNSDFRRLTVLDGDYIFGERCELGFNWADHSDPGKDIMGPGPTVLYREGKRRATYMSFRLPPGWNMNDPRWQVVMQMKQTQPYNSSQAAPMIDLEVRAGRWILADNFDDLWSVPASLNRWTRFAFDVVYSQDPDKGSIQVHVDLNGDRDFRDSGEKSRRIHVATLLAQTDGSDDRVPVGASIPSHLRTGIYHDSTIPCPSSAPCSVDVDNVQVVAP